VVLVVGGSLVPVAVHGHGPKEEPVAGDDAAFPMLDDAEIASLDALGTRRRVNAGETLYRAGDATYDFYAVISGAVEITTPGADGDDRLIVRHDAGGFLGELNLLTGLRVFVTATVVESGEVIAVPAAAMRRALATEPALSDKVLAAYIARRAILMTGAASAIRLVGSRLSPEPACRTSGSIPRTILSSATHFGTSPSRPTISRWCSRSAR
jgi:thioredoxin reductase (NADPH)